MQVWVLYIVEQEGYLFFSTEEKANEYKDHLMTANTFWQPTEDDFDIYPQEVDPTIPE